MTAPLPTPDARSAASSSQACSNLPTPEDVAQMRERHVREVIDVHPGYGEEAWCPRCRVHWPCGAARLLALVDSQEASLRSLDHFADVAEACERVTNTYAARLDAVLAECDRYDQGEGAIEPEDGWRLLRDVRRAATGEGA